MNAVQICVYKVLNSVNAALNSVEAVLNCINVALISDGVDPRLINLVHNCVDMDRIAVSADTISANPATKSMTPTPYDSETHHRRSIRLRGYDYSQPGAYFLTICTQERECLFGDIVEGEMRLNHAGKIVAEEWRQTAAIRKEIQLDQWVVMPNHFHGILTITGPIVGAIHESPP
uniref:REP element-mobilizing transposase RayT n=1 Tax=Candidatus Kentrum sp. LPFa TaxID=2126335 RepID=A0A450WG20_9GAMM|nr:MAG: hypothetical protein BECKLPF1236B_GA0070989_10879 [Candidatus Kentron sp. LPFa]